ncbi:MAG: MOSC N-terminal beta barrel domain-containing protein [Acidobacteriota bacterium]|nr:MOSC N-terminal beta barrel domain-containing protein [Acidobacteriota bacterium]
MSSPVQMRVAEIWRYPIKSMRGERLDRALLGADGVQGDRLVQVFLPNGQVATARRYPRLLALSGTLDASDGPLVNGLPWDSRDAAALVAAATTPGARLAMSEEHRFDILPLLVATDGAVSAFGHDGRRLRPNIVVGGVDGLTEREWEGATLEIDDARIALADLRGRCVMTTVDPDTNALDPEVLRSIVRRFEGRLALNADVARGGAIAVGDPVRIVMPATAEAAFV